MPERLRKILKYTTVFTLILYDIFALLTILEIIVLPYIYFYSGSSILFAVLGCLFGFTIKTIIYNKDV